MQVIVNQEYFNYLLFLKVIVPTSIGLDLSDANRVKEIDININRSKWYINDLLTKYVSIYLLFNNISL